MSCSRKNRMTGKNFMKLIISIWWIAIIKAKSTRKTTTSKYLSSIAKTTSHIKYARKVPNFAARWRSIRKYFLQSKVSNQEKQCKIQHNVKNAPHAYNQIKKNSYHSSQSHYYSNFYLKSKQTHADYAIRAVKRTGNALRQLFEAIISTWWKHLIYQTNLKNQTTKYKTETKNQQQEYEKPKPEKNHTKEQEIKRTTHLTVIGVCTTIRPENSGI